MNLIDTHAHLADAKFRDDLPAVLDRAREAGVHDIVVVADGPAEWEPALAICRRAPGCRAALGIHPHVAKDASEADWRRLETLLDESLVCAVGEAGLDYHYDHSPREVQKAVFENQADLAKRWELPLIVHTREAWEETFAILRVLRTDSRGTPEVLSSVGAASSPPAAAPVAPRPPEPPKRSLLDLI